MVNTIAPNLPTSSSSVTNLTSHVLSHLLSSEEQQKQKQQQQQPKQEEEENNMSLESTQSRDKSILIQTYLPDIVVKSTSELFTHPNSSLLSCFLNKNPDLVIVPLPSINMRNYKNALRLEEGEWTPSSMEKKRVISAAETVAGASTTATTTRTVKKEVTQKTNEEKQRKKEKRERKRLKKEKMKNKYLKAKTQEERDRILQKYPDILQWLQQKSSTNTTPPPPPTQE